MLDETTRPEIADVPIGPSPERLTFLDALRGLGIIFVVGMHAKGYAAFDTSVAADHLWTRVAGASVPMFFLVDGFLFARSVTTSETFTYASYLKKSVSRLLVPWLAFNLLYTAIRAVFEVRGFFPTRLVVGPPFVEVVWNVVDSRVAMQMYFLASLFLIRALAFLWRPLVGRGALVAAIAVTVLIGMSGLRLGEDPFTNALFGIPYYLMGVGFFGLDPKFDRHGRLVAAIGLGLFLGLVGFEPARGGPTWLRFVVQWSLLTGQYALFRASGPWEGLLAPVGRRTMTIYLVHGPVLLKVLAIVGSKLTGDHGAIFAIVWTGSFVGSLGLARLLEVLPFGRRYLALLR